MPLDFGHSPLFGDVFDFVVSGTVAGALHGYFRKIPSIATSVVSDTNFHHEAASRLTLEIINVNCSNPLPEITLLSLNPPDADIESMCTVNITRPAHIAFLENV